MKFTTIHSGPGLEKIVQDLENGFAILLVGVIQTV